MSAKQTRRCVSLSGELYQALAARGAESGQGISTQVEATMRAALGLPPVKPGAVPYAGRGGTRVAPVRPRPSPRVVPTTVPEAVKAPVEASTPELPKSRFITNTLRLTRPSRNPSPERYGLPKRPEKEPTPPPAPTEKSIFTF